MVPIITNHPLHIVGETQHPIEAVRNVGRAPHTISGANTGLTSTVPSGSSMKACSASKAAESYAKVPKGFHETAARVCSGLIVLARWCVKCFSANAVQLFPKPV